MQQNLRTLRRLTRPTLAVVIFAALTGVVYAEAQTYTLPTETATLKPGQGPGYEAAKYNCMACHSFDYINSQPPRMGPAFWHAEVQKMINVYKASITEQDAKDIADYLGKTY